MLCPNAWLNRTDIFSSDSFLACVCSSVSGTVALDMSETSFLVLTAVAIFELKISEPVLKAVLLLCFSCAKIHGTQIARCCLTRHLQNNSKGKTDDPDVLFLRYAFTRLFKDCK